MVEALDQISVVQIIDLSNIFDIMQSLHMSTFLQ
jgi:hypothetical protein